MNESAPPQENKMGVMPVNKLLVSMSVPMVLSMLVQALYNVVDSMFVSQLNENRPDGGIPGVPHPEPDDFGGHRHRRWYQRPAVPQLGRKKL